MQFNKAEQRALNHAINEQIVANDQAFDVDKESSILWMLHTQFGFGPQAPEKGMGVVLFRNPEVTGILPDGSGR
nr:MAG TPA: hypothetical protein [Caudoviricetes sp.]